MNISSSFKPSNPQDGERQTAEISQASVQKQIQSRSLRTRYLVPVLYLSVVLYLSMVPVTLFVVTRVDTKAPIRENFDFLTCGSITLSVNMWNCESVRPNSNSDVPSGPGPAGGRARTDARCIHGRMSPSLDGSRDVPVLHTGLISCSTGTSIPPKVENPWLEAGIEPTTFQAPPYVCYGKARALPTELPPPVRAVLHTGLISCSTGTSTRQTVRAPTH
jgi:hypothetical protein